MKTFRCECGNTLYFENSHCLACGRKLGFAPERMQLVSLEELGNGIWQNADQSVSTATYHLCQNYQEFEVCNWLVDTADAESYCYACRLNETIPDLTKPENHVLWQRIERAKRRLLYTIYSLNLPVVDRASNPEQGLCFQFLSDETQSEFYDGVTETKHVLTGHDNGQITINIAEADPVLRTTMREKMGEEYRTLLGHFRHEIGHYYWSQLLGTPELLAGFRTVFGDERTDYGVALEQYYQAGPKANWQETYISAYACAHPWEDFAETFAHYLHMIDTLDTAYNYGFAISGKSPVSPAAVIKAQQLASEPRFSYDTFDTLLHNWVNLTLVMNALNRSMGMRDAYPFALTSDINNKLRFIHQHIMLCAVSSAK